MNFTIDKSLAIDAGTPKAKGRIIVLHSTDDLDATAKNIATYEHRVWKSAQTFVHYAVDDKDVYQIGKPGYKAWGAGNVNALAPIQIELCEFKNKERALKAYNNWVALAVEMAKQYGAEITLDSSNKTSGIKSHDWCREVYGGTTHSDPYPWLNKIGISKNQLAKDLGSKITSTASTPAKTVYKHASGITWHAQTGSFTLGKNINLRGSASSAGKLIATLKKGSMVKYVAYGYAGGYVWIKQKRGTGYGYLATGTARGTKRTSKWGTFK